MARTPSALPLQFSLERIFLWTRNKDWRRDCAAVRQVFSRWSGLGLNLCRDFSMSALTVLSQTAAYVRIVAEARYGILARLQYIATYSYIGCRIMVFIFKISCDPGWNSFQNGLFILYATITVVRTVPLSYRCVRGGPRDPRIASESKTDNKFVLSDDQWPIECTQHSL